MAHETVPADIDRAIVEYMSAVMAYGQAPFGKRQAEHDRVGKARAALDAAILSHLRGFDDLKATLDRIASGGV